MSQSNESLLFTSVSILDGSNYLVWKNQMKAWLQSKGLWQIMSRNERKFPEADTSSSVAICEVNYKSQMEWDNKDDPPLSKSLSGHSCYKCHHSQCCMAGLTCHLQPNWPLSLSYLYRIQKCDLSEDLYGKSYT